MRKIKALFLIASLSAITSASSANATTSWDGSSATDSVSMTQFGPAFSFVSSGTAFTSAGGNSGSVTTSAGAVMERRDQDNGWDGNFAPGAPLLWNQDSANDITFTFANAVYGVGAQFQADILGPFAARILLNDNSFFDVPGNSTSNADNSAIFIGAKNSVANITAVTFHQLSGSGNNNFAIGNLSLLTRNISGAVPEPATWAMMILGFAIVGAAMRRKQIQTVKYNFA